MTCAILFSPLAAIAARPAPARPGSYQQVPPGKLHGKTAAGTQPAGAVAKAAGLAVRVERLSRILRDQNSAWAYGELSAIAKRKSAGVLGFRTGLALGRYDYAQGNFREAAGWFDRAQKDPLLSDYALYWLAASDLALGENQLALAQFQDFRKRYPDSVMTEQALESLAAAALAANNPNAAVEELEKYPRTEEHPNLLFLRAQAREQANQLPEAAADYETIYLRFPASEKSREAGVRLSFLRGELGDKLPPLALADRLNHAAILFEQSDWADARDEYSALLPELSGADRERAQLRILECGISFGGTPDALLALKPSDPDVAAERLYALAEFYRSQQNDEQMVATIEQLASQAPASAWTERALFSGGNYFWVKLDRDAAAKYYERVARDFAKSPDALPAQWRVAWTALLEGKPEAADLLEAHLREFPGSQYTQDALYWLGRLAEDDGNPIVARAYYRKLMARYPQDYFSALAAPRLRRLRITHRNRAEAGDPPAVLELVPEIPAARRLGGPIPADARPWERRAYALREVAYDSSAELELRAAYAATHSPGLLLEAAQADVRANNCGEAIMIVRDLYPQLEARSMATVPRAAWLAAYALPFEASIRRWSRREGLDPMLVAGLIHQESAFDPKAHSYMNAFGLMQLIPETGRRLARQAGVPYAESRLTDPDYNIRLGTLYLAELRKQFGSLDAALAAYNAGEDRVVQWQQGQRYSEQAEFVDSIPFTETRDYVKIIARNTQIYRKLYGTYEPRRTTAAAAGKH